MKILMLILRVVFFIAMCFFIFIWLLAWGSVHKTPAATLWFFGGIAFGLFIMYFISTVIYKRIVKNQVKG